MNLIQQQFRKNPVFQIIDWYSKDQINEDIIKNNINYETGFLDKKLTDFWNKKVRINLNEFVVYTFGRTEQGSSVTCEITGFNPMFYIKILR